MLNKYHVIIGLIVAILCVFEVEIVKIAEETKQIAAVQESQMELQSKEFEDNFNSSIEKCYDEYDEVKGVNTVDIIDGLSTIHYAVEDNESKKDILNQFIPLFEKVNELGLDDKPLVELFNIILEGM